MASEANLTESGITIPSDSENYHGNNDLSPSPPSSSSSPMILYKPPTIWGLLRGAAINLLLPFINGLMLGFGELFANEAAYRLGWSGTKVRTIISERVPEASFVLENYCPVMVLRGSLALILPPDISNWPLRSLLATRRPWCRNARRPCRAETEGRGGTRHVHGIGVKTAQADRGSQKCCCHIKGASSEKKRSIVYTGPTMAHWRKGAGVIWSSPQ